MLKSLRCLDDHFIKYHEHCRQYKQNDNRTDDCPKIQSNPAGYAIAYFEPSRPLRNNDNLVKDFDVIYVHDKSPGKTLIDVSDIIYQMEDDQL